MMRSKDTMYTHPVVRRRRGAVSAEAGVTPGSVRLSSEGKKRSEIDIIALERALRSCLLVRNLDTKVR